MSHIHFTKNLVVIKDKNIILEDKLSKAAIKNNGSFVLHGTLSDKPSACYYCGCDNPKVMKSSFQIQELFPL